MEALPLLEDLVDQAAAAVVVLVLHPPEEQEILHHFHRCRDIMEDLL
jgi:hypothetical protein